MSTSLHRHREQEVLRKRFRTFPYLSDNYVDLSDNYVDFSDIMMRSRWQLVRKYGNVYGAPLVLYVDIKKSNCR